MKVYEKITVKQTYFRENVISFFYTIYLQAICLAAHLSVEPTMPRPVKRQIYRSNHEVSPL